MNNLKKEIEEINALLGMMECIKSDEQNEVSGFFIDRNKQFLEELKNIKKEKYIKTDERRKELSPMCNKLSKIYKGNFAVKECSGMIEILYNNKGLKKKLRSNEELFDEIIKICSDYFDAEEMWNLAISYDYLNEIPKLISNQERIAYKKYPRENRIKINKDVERVLMGLGEVE